MWYARFMAIDPLKAAFNPSAIIAANQRQSKFIPKAGGYLVVQLPGEMMRVPVEKVIDDDTAIIRLDSPPISRMHSFRFDEVIGVRRRFKNNMDVWEAQTERDFLAEQKRAHKAAQPPEPPVAAPQKKQAAKRKTAAKATR